MKLLEDILAENEERLSRLELAVVNLINSDLEATAANEKTNTELAEIRKAQKAINLRIDVIMLTLEKKIEREK